MKTSHVCGYCSMASGKTQASSWDVYKWPTDFNWAECQGAAKAGLLHQGEWARSRGWHGASPHRQGTVSQHQSRARVVTGPSTRCNGGSGPGLFSELQQETSLETRYQHCRFGVHPRRAVSARTAGDRAGLSNTYDVAQASPGHLRPNLDRAPGPWAEKCGQRSKVRLFRAIKAS